MGCGRYVGVEIIGVFVGEEAFTYCMFCNGVGVRSSYFSFTHVADVECKILN